MEDHNLRLLKKALGFEIQPPLSHQTSTFVKCFISDNNDLINYSVEQLGNIIFKLYQYNFWYDVRIFFNNFNVIFSSEEYKVVFFEKDKIVLHRENGPAISVYYFNSKKDFVLKNKKYYLFGEHMPAHSNDEFNRVLKLKGFI